MMDALEMAAASWLLCMVRLKERPVFTQTNRNLSFDAQQSGFMT